MKKNYEKLISELSNYIIDSDLVRVYKLYGSAEMKTWGIIGKTEVEDVVIV